MDQPASARGLPRCRPGHGGTGRGRRRGAHALPRRREDRADQASKLLSRRAKTVLMELFNRDEVDSPWTDEAVRRAGAGPPRVAFLAEELAVPEAESRAFHGTLGRMGRPTRLAPTSDLLPGTPGALARVAADVPGVAPGGPLTVGRVRDVAGIDRSAVVPVLEFVDRAGFTIRHPGGRALRPDRVGDVEGGP